MTSLATAMSKPAECFRDPQEVLAEAWTPDEKFQVLRQWKYDIGQLHLATEENMQPADSPLERRQEPVSLKQIHAAMTALGYDPASDPVPSKGA
mgnify:CR=1 FL=1